MWIKEVIVQLIGQLLLERENMDSISMSGVWRG